MEQRIGFCRAADGVRLAYAVHGTGPPVVRASTWLTHLEHDWVSPLWRHWLVELGRRYTVIRYDERGCGLSDRDVPVSLDRWVRDLAAVVDAAGVSRFDLLGVSQGGPLAVAYAVRHPERVRRMIFYGAYARGRLRRSAVGREEAKMLVSLVQVGWAGQSPVFRRAFAQLLLPDGPADGIEAAVELQRLTSSAAMAGRIRHVRGGIDVRAEAARVATPTLVMHARHDQMVPFEEGRLLASLIPGAEFVPVDGRNHLPLPEQPAWRQVLDRTVAFLERPDRSGRPPVVLTGRELAVLRLVADGLDDADIARRLSLSVRTVERHLSNVYGKLDVSGKSARAAAAARLPGLAVDGPA
jgi:pimeloyl-ACP methyl ester carboxylesterase/DNA-binding CsgD family transcriptional regulator